LEAVQHIIKFNESKNLNLKKLEEEFTITCCYKNGSKYIYVLGGQNLSTRKLDGWAYKFEVFSLKWIKIKNMNYGRSGPGWCFYGKFLYVIGGFR
jgi:hypothetical protein